MRFEIERKFLVRSSGWQELATDHTSIRQAYLASAERASIPFESGVKVMPRLRSNLVPAASVG